MNPKYFDELHRKNSDPNWVHETFYNNQYPATQDCVEMDKQIFAIQTDIDDINKRKISKKKESDKTYPYSVNMSAVVGGFSFANQANYISWDTIGQKARDKALVFLRDLLNKKKNFSALMDCRNKIETKRQDETATLFTETSAEAEKRILSQTKTKQYFLIGIGAVAILTTLFLFTKKNKS